jgi:N-acetylglucosamine-6-sulfatase
MAVDEGVTRIIDALEATHQLDNTLIVFSSDNGYFWGEHGLGGKHGPYEEAIRVPLLMRYPGQIRRGSVSDALALNIDIAPTFLKAAGVPVPADMQGSALLPVEGHGRPSFLAEFFLGEGTPRFPTWQAVRTDRWKYVRYTGLPEMDELYDLKSDPMEMKNLIHDSGADATREAMKAELEQLLKGDRAPANP